MFKEFITESINEASSEMMFNNLKRGMDREGMGYKVDGKKIRHKSIIFK